MTKRMKKNAQKQNRFLSQAIQLEEAVNPHIINATMSLVSCALIVFLVWAGLTNINEVARTSGEVVPQGHQQMVQHLTGGLIQTILVHEGDIVSKDQVLLTIQDAGLNEDLNRAQGKQLSLELEEERLAERELRLWPTAHTREAESQDLWQPRGFLSRQRGARFFVHAMESMA